MVGNVRDFVLNRGQAAARSDGASALTQAQAEQVERGRRVHEPVRVRPAYSRRKRAFDLLIALPTLVFTAPLMIALAVLIWMHDGASPVFVQTRFGRGGRPFRCYKFRSMVADAEARLRKLLAEDPEAAAEWARDQKLRDDPRITRLGRFIRKSSLDELPQLWNIIRGDMSLIGPRPIVRNEIARYGEDFLYYGMTRPGVTGLWQVSGRNETSYAERIALDVQYVREWSFARDMEILAKTVPAVLFSRGAF